MMNFGEWFGLILSILPLAIGSLVYGVDLGLLLTKRQTISAGVWADLKKWRKGQGRFPWRAIYLPALLCLSGVGLLIHFIS